MRKLTATRCLTFVVLFRSIGSGHADDLWSALKSGNHFVLIRHALAPGYRDPDNFHVKDFKTQHNLHYEGRQQPKNIGNLFRSNRIRNTLVKSSQ